MDKLKIRFSKLDNTLQRLKESIDVFKTTEEGSISYTFMRDSVIKRFEFTFDIFWKCIKVFLSEKHKINVASPRATFKESFIQNIITEEDLIICEKMIADRNNTVHGYNESMAEKIVRNSLSYYDAILQISKRIK